MSMTDNAAKTCTKCGVEQDISCFGKDGSKRTGLSPHCRGCRAIQSRRYYEANKEKCNETSIKGYRDVCDTQEYKVARRKAYMKRTYGITPEDYDSRFIEQGGRCGICGKHQIALSRSLVVDHCHHTGKIRGLLCHVCNVGIGALGDSADLLKNALRYLEITK